jgi:ABC-2 type transport system ATP-binding protein
MIETVVIEASNLTKKYQCRNGTSVLANDGISLKIAKGESIGILGPNGSGKTTFVRQIIGFIQPTSGDLQLFAMRYGRDSAKIRKKVAYMMQQRYSHWDHLTPDEALSYAGRLKGMKTSDLKSDIETLISDFDLGNYRNRMIFGLSGGNKQAISLAVALIGRPELMILDEPTAGLDPVRRKQLWTILKKYQSEFGCTILIVSHNPEEIESVVQKVLVFDSGKVIAEGDVRSLKKKFSGDLRIEIGMKSDAGLELAEKLLLSFTEKSFIQDQKLMVYLSQKRLGSALDALVNNNIWNDTDQFEVVNPSLEDLYISLIGKKME